MKLSEELLDHIDGYEETSGYDARLARWAEAAEALELALEAAKRQKCQCAAKQL